MGDQKGGLKCDAKQEFAIWEGRAFRGLQPSGVAHADTYGREVACLKGKGFSRGKPGLGFRFQVSGLRVDG